MGSKNFSTEQSLAACMWDNKLKSLLLLAGVYTAGAIIGVDRSIRGINATARTVGKGAQYGASKAREGYNMARNELQRRSLTASRNIMIEQIEPPFTSSGRYISSLDLE